MPARAVRGCAAELAFDVDTAAEYALCNSAPLVRFDSHFSGLAFRRFGVRCLGISLQSRTIELAPGDALIAYGRLATAGAIVAAIVQVVVGFYSDARRRRGSRRVEFYVIGAVGGAGAIGFFYGAHTLVALTIAYVAVQAALNLAIGPYQAIIPDFVERDRTGIASSWMAAFQGAGNAIGALAASFIANARWLGAALSALLLATCLVTSAHVRRLTLSRLAGRSGETTAGHAGVRGFVRFARTVYVGFYTLLGYLLFYVNGVLGAATLADGRRETGILIVSFTLVGAVGAALAARPSDRMDKRLVATAGAAGFIVALALFIGSHGLAAVVVATLVAGLGWGVFLVADWAIACRLLPMNAMAAAMGIWNLAIVLPQIIAPALTTAVLQALRLGAGHQAPRVAFAHGSV